MPNCDHWDKFKYQFLTLMLGSYNLNNSLSTSISTNGKDSLEPSLTHKLARAFASRLCNTISGGGLITIGDKHETKVDL